MRLNRHFTPDALALTISGWSRAEVEVAIERLIEMLDGQDAPVADLEPDSELEDGPGDGRIGDTQDAEIDSL